MNDVLSGEQVTYQYDSLTRLTQAQTMAPGGWGQSFGYDGLGNLVVENADGQPYGYRNVSERRSFDESRDGVGIRL